MEAIPFAVTTNGSGNGTATYTLGAPRYLYGVAWLPGGWAGTVDGTLLVVNSPTGVNKTLLTVTNGSVNAWYHPFADVHNSVGSALGTYTPPIVHGDLRLTIAQGGSVTVGTAWAYLEP